MHGPLGNEQTAAPTISTRHLRAFHAVCRHGSVSQASAVLCRAQSAVTRAVLQLESELNVSLFERSVHGMLPTRYGQVLLHRVERAFAYMDTAYRDVAVLSGSARRSGLYMLQMNPRRLKALVELSRRRHMGAAANALGISQPAISLMLRDIERDIGTTLFERGARGLYPTQAGETVIWQLKLALNEIRIAADEVADMQGLKKGEIRVGVLSLGRTYMLPMAITRLLVKHPELRVSTMEDSFEVQVAALRAGEIDFMLGALRPQEHCKGLLREALMDDKMAVLCRAGHPLAKQSGVTLGDTLGYGWVLPHAGTPTRNLFETLFSRRRLPLPKVAVETTDLSIIREVMLESEMLTLVSSHQYRRELSAAMLVELDLHLPETARQVGLLRRMDDRPSPGTQLLLAEVRAITSIPDHLPFSPEPVS
ncbi:MAG TPA: LysR family transcriptional regulator [Pusillimonas sp.]|uniref:LysR family transcriptional regulator n=1 Tax=Pusillimonas sp. TaxID=3040095 RepID=UPI002B4AB462|nr:LysR family transcriptional regulator [Pusillimonas sp.]HLU20819.1 LysR family transcriptional regulator [Pusillimonas sp.]